VLVVVEFCGFLVGVGMWCLGGCGVGVVVVVFGVVVGVLVVVD